MSMRVTTTRRRRHDHVPALSVGFVVGLCQSPPLSIRSVPAITAAATSSMDWSLA
jgi:hypothetical protein